MNINLSQYGIKKDFFLRNPNPARLYQEAMLNERGSAISSTGALVSLSGEKTGRSPKDKRIVEHNKSKDNIWWGDINIPLPQKSHDKNNQIAINYLNVAKSLYIIDGYASWNEKDRIKIRVITTRAYHALFMHNMLIRPTEIELENFGDPDYVIYNAGGASADTNVEGVESTTCISISFEKGEIVILGTEYAGEMKKGVFTIMNYLMPLKNRLSMHCSATAEIGSDKSAILFGLSGTGKTTLSADPRRELIGDDEHIWDENGIYNIEGGCYAKVINLNKEKEPDIFNALDFGAVLENVIYDADHIVDYTRTDITENTRASYPIEKISNARIPCKAGQPSNIIFLTCDAFGILPPVSKLNPQQAIFYFISGYTAKIAGTEIGVTEPEATFSACFGAPFMIWHPTKYASLLFNNIQKYNVNVWLVNTGWAGGAYGKGSRIKLEYSRAIVDAINSGELINAPKIKDRRFGFEIITKCSRVPADILQPHNAWDDKEDYKKQANKLAIMFAKNFEKYAEKADKDTLLEVPKVI